MIDEARVYNTALTPAQIQADMAPLASTTRPPAAGLTATSVSTSQVDLSWLPANDRVGVSGYRVERCAGTGCSTFTQIATPSSTTFSDTALAANTNYSYRVRAVNTGGKLSDYSNTASAFTGLVISPRTATLTFTRTQQFVAQGGTATWSVDGVTGGSAATGTVTAGGLYTPPSAAGTHVVTATTGTQSVERDRVREQLSRHFHVPRRQPTRTGAEPHRNGSEPNEREHVDVREALHVPNRRDRTRLAAYTSRTLQSRDRASTTSSTSRRSTTASTRSMPTDGAARRSGRTASSTRAPASRPSLPAIRRVLRHLPRDRHHEHTGDRPCDQHDVRRREDEGSRRLEHQLRAAAARARHHHRRREVRRAGRDPGECARYRDRLVRRDAAVQLAARKPAHRAATAERSRLHRHSAATAISSPTTDGRSATTRARCNCSTCSARRRTARAAASGSPVTGSRSTRRDRSI